MGNRRERTHCLVAEEDFRHKINNRAEDVADTEDGLLKRYLVYGTKPKDDTRTTMNDKPSIGYRTPDAGLRLHLNR